MVMEWNYSTVARMSHDILMERIVRGSKGVSFGVYDFKWMRIQHDFKTVYSVHMRLCVYVYRFSSSLSNLSTVPNVLHNVRVKMP